MKALTLFSLLLLLGIFAFSFADAKRVLLSEQEAQSLGVGLTPFGYLPKECIHAADNGAEILQEGSLLTIKEGAKERKIEGDCRSITAPLPSGWSVYAAWIDKTPLQYFGAAWTVPPLPTDEGTQVLFLFNGLQNDGPVLGGKKDVPTTIIQPVLQYGVSEAGGGTYWAIASWFVSSTGHAVYSKLTTVSVGDLLLGNMTNTNGQWDIVTYDTNSGESVTISVRPGAAELYAAITLEVYQVSSCLEYPQGSTSFFALDLKDNNGQVIASWTPNVLPGCKEALDIQSPTTINIKW